MNKPPHLPSRLNVLGKYYELVILRVELKDENGIPTQCAIIKGDDSVVELNPSDVTKNEFITAYIPEFMMKPENERNKK